MSRTVPSACRISSPLPDNGLRVDVCQADNEVVLRVYGEADLCGGPVLDDALASAFESNRCQAQVVLNFEGLRFIDAHCLGIIARAQTQLNESGRDLFVRSPAPFARRVLEICGMDALIEG